MEPPDDNRPQRYFRHRIIHDGEFSRPLSNIQRSVIDYPTSSLQHYTRTYARTVSREY
jgi:hypothetical protein